MPSLAQSYRIDAQVHDEIAHYMARPCSPARADGLTPVQAITPLTKAIAAAEWEAMDARGNLPDWWLARKAEIEAQFAMKEESHG